MSEQREGGSRVGVGIAVFAVVAIAGAAGWLEIAAQRAFVRRTAVLSDVCTGALNATRRELDERGVVMTGYTGVGVRVGGFLSSMRVDGPSGAVLDVKITYTRSRFAVTRPRVEVVDGGASENARLIEKLRAAFEERGFPYRITRAGPGEQ
jgi:hypothetical protein